MYEAFFGLKEKPFQMTPDTRYFYPSAKHTDALNHMVYAIQERRGFVVISGEIGSGKTTLSRMLFQKLDPATRTAIIRNTHLTAKDLILSVLEDLEIPSRPSCTKTQLIGLLNEFLVDQLREDNNVVLLIDEAQNLRPSVLEEVRMLSNLETETEKLIQIVLMGQPELRSKLWLRGLTQLRQRVTLHYHLGSLDDKIDGFHYYTTYIKFGLGRASYDASQEIRNHHLTRQEGVALVRRFDGEFPEKYFSEILSSLEIKPERFLALCDNFRPAHLWEKVEGKWRLRHPVV